MQRAMQGFQGPQDIFRNADAFFRQFKPTASDEYSPFELTLNDKGTDFAVMDMHFKLGLYEHQSASAIEGLLELINKNPQEALLNGNIDNIERIKIISYEPAFSIIGDASKRTPTCRQSADHSMVYIVATLLRKAFEKYDKIVAEHGLDELWKYLMLLPIDYSKNAIFNETTRKLMAKIEFEHGGPEYDAKYPEGIPTSIQIYGKG